MTAYVADRITYGYGIPESARQGSPTVVESVYTVGTALAITDTVAMLKLPPNHMVVDAVLFCEELDSGADAIVLEVGILGGDTDSIIAASTVGQAGGVERMNVATQLLAAQSNSEQTIAITVATGPGTGATAVDVGLMLTYRPAQTEE